MKITKKTFLESVTKEVEALKQHATPKELARLDIESLDPDERDNCIYGQMTGDCGSKRAKTLMDKACVRTMEVPRGTIDLWNRSVSQAISKGYVNGDYNKQTWDGDYRDWSYLSALEGYISTKDAKTQNIVEYLRDTTGTVKLKL